MQCVSIVSFRSGAVKVREAVCEHHFTLSKREAGEGSVAVELRFDAFTACSGEPGFFLLPGFEENGLGSLTRFRRRADARTEFPIGPMPVVAVSHRASATLAVVRSMEWQYRSVVTVKDNCYQLSLLFAFDPDAGENEEIRVEFLTLSGETPTPCDIARRYREDRFARGACMSLAERAKTYPLLARAARGPEVRIRMAWKPVPSPVPEQTEENEPPLHVAVTFRQAGEILDEFHRQGIRDAHFCLIGWNKSGHDGRFPDLFPVEPALGGEEDLLKLTAKAKQYGYLMSAHTNVLDSYTVAGRWRREDMLERADGSPAKGGIWGGGQSYFYCPEAAFRIAGEDFPELRRLGFSGLHYLDVMSIIVPEACRNPLHPLTRREAGEWRAKTLELARRELGGSASEGPYDFCIGSLDYVLYTVFHRDHPLPELCDATFPFWHAVYHGVVLYNTFCDTVNAAIKGDWAMLLNQEYGGRPLYYFHAKFLDSGVNWMGNEDLRYGSGEELREQVAKLKQDCDRYARMADLQYAFWETFELLSDAVTRIVHSNGSELLVNRGATPFVRDGKTVPPCSVVRIDR